MSTAAAKPQSPAQTSAQIPFKAIEWKDLDAESGVAAILDHVVELGASDLFLAANETDVSISMRHLGMIDSVATLPQEQGRRFMTHIRAVAGMDTTERRHPIDGRWVRHSGNGRTVDLRINTIPTLYGDDMAIKLLVRDSEFRRMEGLGLLNHQHHELLNLLNQPSGLILVTGPTGSGKSTTLYACLHYLNNGQRKINTIEDPIEYSMGGIRQSQVNLRIGLDFPELLRSVLRQSPDVIMIGEIRDPVTAETAVRAANSGHLVCATLHAPVAAGAIESMLSLGVHPHFLATGLLAVLAQRLVRTLCPACKLALDLGDAAPSFDDVRPWLSNGQGHAMYTATGCDACRQTGYTQRTGIFEVLCMSAEMRRRIGVRQPSSELEQQALREGMIDFRRGALLKIAQGQTNIEEVLRTVPAEHLFAAKSS